METTISLIINSNPFSHIKNLIPLSVRNKYVATIGLAAAAIVLVGLAAKVAFAWIQNRSSSTPKYTIISPNLSAPLSITIPLSSTVSEAFQIIDTHLSQAHQKKISCISQPDRVYVTIPGLGPHASTQFSDWCHAGQDRKVNFSILLEDENPLGSERKKK